MDNEEKYFRDNFESVTGKKADEYSIDYILGYLDAYKAIKFSGNELPKMEFENFTERI